MKQTAVEWLIEQLPTIDKYDPYYANIITQAKEMEKEIMHAEYMRGWKDGLTKQEKR
jgi:hypothetical protein